MKTTKYIFAAILALSIGTTACEKKEETPATNMPDTTAVAPAPAATTADTTTMAPAASTSADTMTLKKDTVAH